LLPRRRAEYPRFSIVDTQVYRCCFPLLFVIVTRYPYWHLPSTPIYIPAPTRLGASRVSVLYAFSPITSAPGSAVYSCHRLSLPERTHDDDDITAAPVAL
jgi:hypothetical protein